MSDRTDWQWWSAACDDVDCEDVYTFGEFATRDEAVAAAVRELAPGDLFYVIEARSATAEPRDSDVVPFLETRNKAMLIHRGTHAEEA